ncbi:methionyl-tRNA formyltransferase [Spiroplasma endosymbiont of Crioceris asparagi]|uniref:methionyl-tRNA formyltransferase n=1 Tax=Spiroplasma endosymbiont of Crioceris asparagi TaxID=3066286 RepID=UPI0030CCB354
MFNIIFCGTLDISRDILKTLFENKHYNILGVITQTDKEQGRGQKISQNSVKKFCIENNIKCFQPTKMKEIYDEVLNLKPDFLITCAYGKILPESFLNIFKNSINFHASLLPKYRGGSPVQKAIANGEKETGISLMKMIKQMDAGEVYFQKSILIELHDNAQDIFAKLSKISCDIVGKELIQVLNGELKGKPQDESKVTFAYNLKNEDEKIDWNKTSLEIHNFIRSLAIKPGAFSILNNARIKILASDLPSEQQSFKKLDLKVGTIFDINKLGMFVKTIDGAIIIKLIQKESKNITETKALKNNPQFLNKIFNV